MSQKFIDLITWQNEIQNKETKIDPQLNRLKEQEHTAILCWFRPPSACINIYPFVSFSGGRSVKSKNHMKCKNNEQEEESKKLDIRTHLTFNPVIYIYRQKERERARKDQNKLKD